MKQIKAAIIGAGFIGRVHLDALQRIEGVQIAAIIDPYLDQVQRLAEAYSIPLVSADIADVLQNSEIESVHICTPNAQHAAMVKAALAAGKHVACEKPLATSLKNAEELVALAQSTGLRNCLCHNLRFYPMVQQMRAMIAAGELGDVLAVRGSYAQDWLLYETDWNWRVDSKVGGVSRCMADIGTHWFDMAEHVTGLRVSSLCADLKTFHPQRKEAMKGIETFSKIAPESIDYIARPVDTEDYGAVIFHMGQRVRGSVTAMQTAAGRKNALSLEVNGSRASVAWNQERPDELWIGSRDEGNRILLKDPSLLHDGARLFANLPGGHSEGFYETSKQLFRRFYAAQRGAAVAYPELSDGLRQLRILDAELESNRQRCWVDLDA